MISESNLLKFLTGQVSSRQATSSILNRVEFTYRGRSYVAIRFRGGRPELYRVEKDGYTETFLRYAWRSLGGADARAVELVEDWLDPAAKTARDLLAGRYPEHTAQNVRLGPAAGEWGSVVADYVDPQTGLGRKIHASFRLFTRVS